MRIELPNDAWAEITPVDELTERQNRLVERSLMRAEPISARLRDSGFDADKKETWGVYLSLSDDELDLVADFQVSLIAAMVYDWSFKEQPKVTHEGDTSTIDWPTGNTLPINKDNALNLKPDVYEVLAMACYAEYNSRPVVDAKEAGDPKASTDASTG